MGGFDVVYQTRKIMFDHVSKKRVENMACNRVFLTNFEVFGSVVNHCLECLMNSVSSQSKLKLRRKWRDKNVKIYANQDQISKQHHDHDFLCLNLINY